MSKEKLVEFISTYLSLTKNRFPKDLFLENEILSIFSLEILNHKNLKEFCEQILKFFSRVVLDKHLYDRNWTSSCWFEGRITFIEGIKQMSKGETLILDFEALWRLLFEEFWWKSHGFNDYKNFAHIPTQEQLRKKSELQNNEVVFINYYDLDVKNRDSSFGMGKKAHDFIRYYIWGYHYTFPYKQTSREWWCSKVLNLKGKIDHLVLIDLDNAGKSIKLLNDIKFKYKNTKFFAFCGFQMKETELIKDCIKNGVLELYKIDLTKKLEDMDSLERYLNQFYENNYFKKYKNVADYALSAFCGAIHRFVPLDVQLWVISKDDGLDWPVRNSFIRGRVSKRVPEEDMLETLDKYIEMNIPSTTDIDIKIKELENEQFVIVKREEKKYELSELSKKEIEQAQFLENEQDMKYVEEKIGDYINESLLKDLSVSMVKLRGVRIGCNGIERMLKCFKEMKKIKKLELRGCRIRDQGFIGLLQYIKNNHLDLLDLSSCLLTDQAGIALGKALPELDIKILDLRWNKLSFQSMLEISKGLEKNKSITAMTLRDNKFGYEGIEQLLCNTNNDSIVTLDIYRCSEEVDISLIFGKEITLKSLTSLDVSGNRISAFRGFPVMAKYIETSNLTRLILDYNPIRNNGCLHLANVLCKNTTLVVLSLSRSLIGDLGAEYLAYGLENNSTLTYLDIQRNSISNAGLIALSKALNKNQTLYYLDLKRNHIGDNGVIEFSKVKNTTLTSIDLSHNNITSKGVSALGASVHNFSSVCEIFLTNNPIGDFGLSDLSKNLKNIETLSIEDCDIKEVAVQELLKNDYKNLHYLKLSKNKIGYGSFEKNLKELKTWIPSTKCKPLNISDIFKYQLSHLDISENDLGDEGVKDLITDSLIQSKTLAFINLSSNNITKEGSKSIAKLLENNNSIVTLVISSNQLQDDGIENICNSLEKNNSLTTLISDNNYITSKGAKFLGKLIQNEGNLISIINLANNLIDDECVDVISQGVVKSEALVVLNLERNGYLTQKGRKYLLENSFKSFNISGQVFCTQLFM